MVACSRATRRYKKGKISETQSMKALVLAMNSSECSVNTTKFRCSRSWSIRTSCDHGALQTPIWPRFWKSGSSGRPCSRSSPCLPSQTTVSSYGSSWSNAGRHCSRAFLNEWSRYRALTMKSCGLTLPRQTVNFRRRHSPGKVNLKKSQNAPASTSLAKCRARCTKSKKPSWTKSTRRSTALRRIASTRTTSRTVGKAILNRQLDRPQRP